MDESCSRARLLDVSFDGGIRGERVLSQQEEEDGSGYQNGERVTHEFLLASGENGDQIEQPQKAEEQGLEKFTFRKIIIFKTLSSGFHYFVKI